MQHERKGSYVAQEDIALHNTEEAFKAMLAQNAAVAFLEGIADRYTLEYVALCAAA